MEDWGWGFWGSFFWGVCFVIAYE